MEEQQLTEFLKSEAGRFLRGVVRYDADQFTIVYVRDDVNDDHFRTRVAQIYDRLIEYTPEDTSTETFGKPYATLNIREHAVILNLRWGPSERVLIGLDLEAGRQLVSFVHESMERGFPDGRLDN